MRFVHDACLLAWLEQAKGVQCEVCRHAFTFTLQYRANAPSTLPPLELLVGVARRSARSARYAARCALCCAVWLGCVLGSCLLWRLAFSPSAQWAAVLSAQAGRLAPLHVALDAAYGVTAIFSVLLFVLLVSSLRDHLRGAREPAELAVAAAEAAEALAAAAPHAEGARAPRAPLLPLAMPPPPPGLEELILADMVGLRGPLSVLFENAFTVLVSNALLLFAAAYIPLVAGRAALRALGSWQPSARAASTPWSLT